MKLKDIADMEDYLENRCCCPYEICDITGFFFNSFDPDAECELLVEGERGSVHGTFVMAKSSQFNSSLQIIYIEHKDGYVESCLRLDATENNKEQIVKFLNGEVEKMDIDKYADTKTEESLKEKTEESLKEIEWLKELKGYRSIKDQIAFAKRNIRSENSDYLTGYISALSAVEGMIAEVENAESECEE